MRLWATVLKLLRQATSCKNILLNLLHPPPRATMAVDIVVASGSQDSMADNTLTFNVNETLYVLSKPNDQWWDAVRVDGSTGLVTRGWISPDKIKQPSNTEYSSTTGSDEVSRTTSHASYSQRVVSEETPSTKPSDTNLHFTPMDEIKSYFDPVMGGSSALSFAPLWFPQLTTDDKIVYRDYSLNVLSKELPLLNDAARLENPDVSSVAAGLYTIPVSLNDSNVSDQEKSVHKPSLAQSVNSVRTSQTPTSVSFDAPRKPTRYRKLSSCLPNDFYLTPTDITTWNQLYSYFQSATDAAMDALNQKDKTLFRTQMDIVSTTVATYQMIVRLSVVVLKKTRNEAKISSFLKDITDSLVQFIINGNLYLMNQGSNYLHESQSDLHRMLKHATRISRVFGAGLPGDGEPERLPLLYTRWIRDKFDATNFTNPIVQEDNDHHHGNVLLDDTVIKKLSKQATDLIAQLNEVIPILDSVTGIASPLDYGERNAGLLKYMSSCLPHMCRYLDTLEAIDMGVFAMILHHASDTGKEGFYQATATNLEPLLKEFIHLKQIIHTLFTELVLDSQLITADDPQVFASFTTEDEERMGNFNNFRRSLKTELFASGLLQTLNARDNRTFHGDLFRYEPVMKLRKNIHSLPDQLATMLSATVQLKEQREIVLNYCSRLMNNDFNIASFFVAERHNTMVSTQNEYYYGRNDSELPWYLEPDEDERQLIYDNNGVKGGPVKSLISRLVDPISKTDSAFEETLLDLFTTICTPTQLLDLLKQALNPPLPEGLSYEEYGNWVEKMQKPRRSKIFDVVQHLFTHHWHAYYSESIHDIWNEWTNDPLVPRSLIECGDKVIKYTDQNQYLLDYNSADSPHVKAVSTPMPLALTPEIKRIRLQDISIDVIMEQITIIQQELFYKITKTELYARSYNFKKILPKNEDIPTKNIKGFIRNCNQLTHFVIYMILRKTDLIQRAATLKSFISLADKLMEIRNFSAMTAVISGLSSTSISRLKMAWSIVPKAAVEKFERMDKLMSIGKNYSEYRNMLKFITDDGDECLPFLGMYLSDLRFTTDGNPDYIHGDRSQINFSKRLSINKIVTEVLDFGRRRYKYKRNEAVIGYLLVMMNNIPDDEKLYEMSIQLEPRMSLKDQKRPAKRGSAAPSVFSRMAQKAKKSQSSIKKR